MNYTLLDPTYKDDTIAEAMHARELEHFHYAFDATNFEHLLARTPPGPYHDQIAARLASTREQMANVEAIYAALQAQITDPAAHAAAVVRAIEKRKAPPCPTP